MSDVEQVDPPNQILPAPLNPVRLPDKDAREYALEGLADWIATLQFRRTGVESKPTFTIPRDRIQVYMPDDLGVDADLASIAIVPGEGEISYLGIGEPEIDDSSFGIAGPNTAIITRSEWVETITIEVMSSKHATRRGVVAGLIASMASDGASVLKLRLPQLFGVTAIYSSEGASYIDDLVEEAKGRRRASLKVSVAVPMPIVVNAVTMQPIIDIGGLEASCILDGNVFANLQSDLNQVLSVVERGECPAYAEQDLDPPT